MRLQDKQTRDYLLLALLLLTFIATALAYSATIPPYENQDEIEHAEVVRHIATTGKLPVHGEAEAAGYHTRQESSQPPLYHILAAGWVRLWNLPLDAHDWQAMPTDVVACGDSQTLYDKATWVNDPALAAESPFIRTLKATRLFSILLAMGGLTGLYILARRVFPKGVMPAFVVAIVAFNPQFLFISSGVNNDNLMTALAMWGLLLAFDLWDKGPTFKRVLLMSVLAGLGGLSKLSGVGLVGLGGLAILLYAIRTRMPFGKLVLWGMLIVLPAALILTPWLLRNYRLYGDLTALAPMLEKVGHRDYPIDWHEGRIMLLSYWAQTPCSFYPRAVYWPFFLLLGGGLTGVILKWQHFHKRLRELLGLSAVWFVVITLAWLRWDLITPATGGRLLFPACGALALILAAGWHGFSLPAGKGVSSHSSKWWTVALPILALISLRAGPVFLFGRPQVVDTLLDDVTPVSYEFGDAVALRGYSVEVRRPWLRCIFVGESYCGPALDFTLVWERITPLDEDWTFVGQLVSPVPGATDVRFNLNRWPGHGNMPTSTMPDGLIVDHYVVPLDEWPNTQAWSFQVGFTRDGQRIPLTEGGEDTVAYLDLVRAPELPNKFGSHLGWPARGLNWAMYEYDVAEARFQDGIKLEAGYTDMDYGMTNVYLEWLATGRPSLDYSVFIHAYDADGELLASADNPPDHFAFPMSLWLRWDRHSYSANIPYFAEGITTVAVGLYDSATGVRLPVKSSTHRVENDAVIIWEQGE